jgi:hypothetical protein
MCLCVSVVGGGGCVQMPLGRCSSMLQCTDKTAFTALPPPPPGITKRQSLTSMSEMADRRWLDQCTGRSRRVTRPAACRRTNASVTASLNWREGG